MNSDSGADVYTSFVGGHMPYQIFTFVSLYRYITGNDSCKKHCSKRERGKKKKRRERERERERERDELFTSFTRSHLT